MWICKTLVAMVVISNCAAVASQSCPIPACAYEDVPSTNIFNAHNHSHHHDLEQDMYCANLDAFFDCIYNAETPSSTKCPNINTACLSARAACPTSFKKCGCSIDYCNSGLVYKHFGGCGDQGSTGKADCPTNNRNCVCNEEQLCDACSDPSACGAAPSASSRCSDTECSAVQINLHCGSLLPQLPFASWFGLAAGMLIVGSVMGFLAHRFMSTRQSSRRTFNPLMPNDATIQMATGQGQTVGTDNNTYESH